MPNIPILEAWWATGQMGGYMLDMCVLAHDYLLEEAVTDLSLDLHAGALSCATCCWSDLQESQDFAAIQDSKPRLRARMREIFTLTNTNEDPLALLLNRVMVDAWPEQ